MIKRCSSGRPGPQISMVLLLATGVAVTSGCPQSSDDRSGKRPSSSGAVATGTRSAPDESTALQGLASTSEEDDSGTTAETDYLTTSGPASDLIAIARLADAWTNRKSIATAVSDLGLLVATGSTAVNLEPAALADVKGNPPPMPTDECPTANLNQASGETFLSTYYARTAKVYPWPSTRPEWEKLRCYGIVNDRDAPVRVCVDGQAPSAVRVRAIETRDTDNTGDVDRPPSEAPGYDRALPKTVPSGLPRAVTSTVPIYNVVLVPQGRQLEARAEPRPGASVVTTLSADSRSLMGTGESVGQGLSRWVQIQTTEGPAWVRRQNLARVRSRGEIVADSRYEQVPLALLDALGRAKNPDLGIRGLYVMHFADPVHITADEWSTAVVEKKNFNSAACEACVAGTLQDLLDMALTDTLRDAAAVRAVGTMQHGPNRSWLVPLEFSGFNLVTVYDPQDTDCIGYDWKTVAFFFDEENGAPKIVGVGFDSWSP